MRSLCLSSRTARIAGIVALVFAISQKSLHGQVRALVTNPVDDTKLAVLKGNVSPRLTDAKDVGAADVSQASGRLMLVLKRSPEREAALQSFLQQAHETSSANFHKWLTPATFAQQYGVADSDIEQVSGWLQSHGLKVAGTAAGKGTIEFGGTIGQVNEAFHTSIHRYSVHGETHYANANDPSIPAALAPVVAGVTQLNDFRPTPAYKLAGRAQYEPKTHTGKPQWTMGTGAGYPIYYFLTPEDFSTQYDVKPVYTAGVTGSGQTIGIINASNIDVSLVNAYRKLFGLPVNPPQIVIDGNDPGVVSGLDTEAYLDVENAGAVAPAATVKLYIAGSYGELGDGGVFFSMVRAVNDDAANVLSLSFGVCEESGTSQNQFINSLWEQAAAQGQTVMVSTGDSGSQGCYGLGVNGFASTPWDIGVGGTDAYFTDYATGGASISTFWNNTNDANLGSLQTKMTEQVWNGTQFGLNSITYDPVEYQPQNTGAGSGGASACAVGGVDPNTGALDCTSGYPKPSWQVGTGVPNDGVRDLPDVSLFASNGYNGVLWPICAEAGDCTEANVDLNTLYVTGVGGTSASAPAMAGVMALIDQKYGAQGQANFTLYALAAQYPAAYNDITHGSNNEPCASFQVGFFIGCAKDPNDSYYSLQNYSTGVGYDQASGLGTVDVDQVLTNWSKVSFKTSVTTLSLTPTTITHGQTVTASAAVTGTGTPTGAVALVTSTTLPNNKGITAIALGTGGTGSETINYLPGGTYTVVGQYSGDGVNGASNSSPVTMTVNPEQSTLTFTPQYLVFNYNTYQNQGMTITANAQVPYGNNVLMDVQIAGASGTADGNPTGTVTFTNGTATLGTVSVSAAGTAEFNASSLPPGTYTIGGTYSGDASYKGASFGPITFSIVKAQAYLALEPNPNIRVGYISGPNGYFPGEFYYQVGQEATLVAFVNPVLNFPEGLQPTGTVTFQLGTAAPQTLTLTPQQNLGISLVSACTQVYSSLPAGTTPLTVTYNGDANYIGSSTVFQLVVAADTLLNSTTTFTITPSNLANLPGDTVITAQATVTGSGTTAPTGNILFQLDNIYDVGGPNINLTPGSGNTSTASVQFRAADLFGGSVGFSVNYLGDSVYAPSSSGAVTIGELNTDFSIQAQESNLAIAAGASGTVNLNLTPLNGFSGPVALSCSAPSSLVCAIASPVTLSGNGTTTVLTLTAAVPSTSTAKNQVPNWRKTAGGAVLACLLICAIPKRRRLDQMLLVFIAVGALLGSLGCGGSGKASTPITPTPTATNTPAGTYTVVATGTSSTNTIHNATITLIVQ